jgi:hypothetical protein
VDIINMELLKPLRIATWMTNSKKFRLLRVCQEILKFRHKVKLVIKLIDKIKDNSSIIDRLRTNKDKFMEKKMLLL